MCQTNSDNHIIITGRKKLMSKQISVYHLVIVTCIFLQLRSLKINFLFFYDFLFLLFFPDAFFASKKRTGGRHAECHYDMIITWRLFNMRLVLMFPQKIVWLYHSAGPSVHVRTLSTNMTLKMLYQIYQYCRCNKDDYFLK